MVVLKSFSLALATLPVVRGTGVVVKKPIHVGLPKGVTEERVTGYTDLPIHKGIMDLATRGAPAGTYDPHGDAYPWIKEPTPIKSPGNFDGAPNLHRDLLELATKMGEGFSLRAQDGQLFLDVDMSPVAQQKRKLTTNPVDPMKDVCQGEPIKEISERTATHAMAVLGTVALLTVLTQQGLVNCPMFETKVNLRAALDILARIPGSNGEQRDTRFVDFFYEPVRLGFAPNHTFFADPGGYAASAANVQRNNLLLDTLPKVIFTKDGSAIGAGEDDRGLLRKDDLSIGTNKKTNRGMTVQAIVFRSLESAKQWALGLLNLKQASFPAAAAASDAPAGAGRARSSDWPVTQYLLPKYDVGKVKEMIATLPGLQGEDLDQMLKDLGIVQCDAIGYYGFVMGPANPAIKWREMEKNRVMNTANDLVLPLDWDSTGPEYGATHMPQIFQMFGMIAFPILSFVSTGGTVPMNSVGEMNTLARGGDMRAANWIMENTLDMLAWKILADDGIHFGHLKEHISQLLLPQGIINFEAPEFVDFSFGTGAQIDPKKGYATAAEKAANVTLDQGRIAVARYLDLNTTDQAVPDYLSTAEELMRLGYMPNGHGGRIYAGAVLPPNLYGAMAAAPMVVGYLEFPGSQYMTANADKKFTDKYMEGDVGSIKETGHPLRTPLSREAMQTIRTEFDKFNFPKPLLDAAFALTWPDDIVKPDLQVTQIVLAAAKVAVCNTMKFKEPGQDGKERGTEAFLPWTAIPNTVLPTIMMIARLTMQNVHIRVGKDVPHISAHVDLPLKHVEMMNAVFQMRGNGDADNGILATAKDGFQAWNKANQLTTQIAKSPAAIAEFAEKNGLGPTDAEKAPAVFQSHIDIVANLQSGGVQTRADMTALWKFAPVEEAK